MLNGALKESESSHRRPLRWIWVSLVERRWLRTSTCLSLTSCLTLAIYLSTAAPAVTLGVADFATKVLLSINYKHGPKMVSRFWHSAHMGLSYQGFLFV